MCLSRRREEKSACMTQQRRRTCDVTGWGEVGGAHRGHFCLPGVSPSGRRGTGPGAVFLTSCRCGSASAVTYFLFFLCSLTFPPALTALISPSRPFFAPFFLALLLEVRRECRSSASVLGLGGSLTKSADITALSAVAFFRC